MSDPSSPVWFYLVGTPGEEARLRAACQVTEKAWSSGRRVLVCAEDVRAASRFDQLLWTFRQDSFVPHALANNADAEDEVVVDAIDGPACRAAAAGVELDVLVTLVNDAPAWGLTAKRVAAFIGGDEQEKADGRALYRRWQALGVRPYTVEMNK